MTRAELKAAGEALYGERWQSPLARALGMSDRHMRRLVDGTAEIHDGIAKDIRDLLKARQKEIGALLRTG